MIFVFCWKYGNRGKNITKNLRDKYGQKLLYHATMSATDAL